MVWLCSLSLPYGWQQGGGQHVPLNIIRFQSVKVIVNFSRDGARVLR